MVEYFEYEIQVLGLPTPASKRAPKRKPPTWFWLLVALLVCALVAGGVYWYLSRSHEAEAVPAPEEKFDYEEPVPTPTTITPVVENSEIAILEAETSNDVPLRIYALGIPKAELVVGLPDKEDTDILLAAQAADVRRDNGGIVGDFVLQGNRLAQGKRKEGYCSIIGREVSIGVSASNEKVDDCILLEGDFFRQYPLVVNGEIQMNRLKGKSVRRALAQSGRDFYIIESLNRESLYDFSEALVDIGITDALYLVGGNSYGFYRVEGRLYEFGVKNTRSSSKTSYIVFKKR